ncbi:MAG: hypothetical protein A4C66_04015, partial [Nitrospira sp. HN-bin3]
TTWTAVGTVSNTSALLLADNGSTRLYFAPNANYNGTSSAALTVRAWDQTSGTAGTKVTTASTGGTTAFSSATDTIDVSVTAVNDAPVLADTALSLTVTEDAGAPSGAVGSLVSAFTGGITDVDSGASKGIAITGSNETNGTWYYTTNGGTTWTAVGSVSSASSLLLADNGSTRLYFAPSANYNGTSTAALTVRAWDQTSGTAGTKVTTASNGGTTAFSSATDTIDVSVTAVNDAPVFTSLNGTPTYTENGSPVVLDSNVTITDAELTAANNFNGATLTLTRNGGANSQDVFSGSGTLSLSGGNVVVSGTTIGTYTNSGGTLVFTFNSNATNTLVNSAMQQIAYSNSSDAPPSSVQINWAFSDGNSGGQGTGGALTATGSVTVSITAINDAPTITSNGGGATASLGVAEGLTAVTTVTATDVDAGQTLTFSIVGGADAAKFTINSSTGALSFVTAPNYEAPTDSGGNNIYDVTVQVSDGNGGTDTQALSVTVTHAGAGVTISSLEPTPLGNEYRVNTTTAGDQWAYYWSVRTVALAQDGSYVQVWIDTGGADGSQYGIYGQRYDSNGTAVGGQFLVNTTTTLKQDDASVAMAPDGSFVVLWDGPGDGNGTGVFGQRFAADGSRIGGEFQVNTSTASNQQYPELDFAADGSFVTTWVTQSGGPARTYFQRFDASGNKVGGEVVLNTGSSSDQILDSLHVKADGSFIVTWTEGTGVAAEVYGQLYDANTNPVSSAFQINQYTTGVQQYSIVRADANGNFVVVWESQGQDGSGNGVYMRRFAADGTALGNEVAVTTQTAGDQYGPVLAMDRYGNFVVAWGDSNAADGSGDSIWMQRFDASGNKVGVSMQVNQSTAGYQGWPVIDMNDDGRLVVAWEGSGSGDDYGVYARRYDLNPNVTEGSTSQFQVVLNTAPTSAVTLTLSVSDGTEASLSTTTLVFDSTNWNIPQTVTISGLQDLIADGDQSIRIITSALSSSDSSYNGLNPDNLVVLVQDSGVGNTAPVISSNGGGATASISVAENTTAVTTVAATDANTGQTLTYSIVGGADAAKFTINSVTGILSFITAPNYESPTDSGGNNIYDVTVQVSDSLGATDTQAIAVTVTNANETPTDLTLSANTVAENAANGTTIGTVSGTDPDSGDTKTYSFTDSAGGRFAINSSTGVITVANSSLLNYESATSHSVTVRVTDSGGLTYDETFTINLTNVNETPTDLTLSANTVAENAANGTIIGTVSGTDPDSGDTKSYSFTDSAGGRFAVNSSTGVITVANSSLLNYEAATSHSVTVRVTDSGGLTYDETFTINVTNVNEAPTGADATVTINEDTSHTLTTANFGFSDADTGDSLSAVRVDTLPGAGSLTLSGVAVTAGQIITAADITAGNLVFTPAANANGTGYASFTFSVRDSNSTYDTAPNTLTVNVTPVNDAPINTVPGAQTVAVDTPLVLSGLSVNDVDGNLSTVQLSVTNGTVAVTLSGGATISSGASGTSTLTLTGTQADINATLTSLTYQGNSLFTGTDTLTVVSTDSNSVSDTDTVMITVSNNAPTNVLPASQTVAEDTPLAISGLSVTDTDGNLATVQLSVTNGTLNLTLSGATTVSGGFNGSSTVTLSGTQADLNATLASLIYQGHLNFAGSDTLTITSTDSTGTADTDNLSITVTAVNDTPTDLSLSANQVAENAANGTTVGTVSGTDPDAGDTKTYSFTDSAGGRFAINSSTGVITVANSSLLDYEAATSHSVTVRVTDAGGLTYDETFTINVTNVNETPTDLSLSANQVAENAANGTTVGTVSGTDPDAGDTKTYSFTDSAGGRFAINSSTGEITVADGSLLDYEAATSHSVTVRVTDSGGLTYDETFTINLTNVNETPTDLSLSSNTVAENAANGTVIGTVSGTDPDSGDTKTYSFTNSAGGRFAINSSTGEITVADGSLLNYEAATSHNVTVRVTDVGGLTYDEMFTINVTDVNETPTDLSLSANTITENAATGTIIGTVTGTDPDIGDTKTYSLTDSAGGRFSIHSATGQISVANSSLLDYEAATSHTVTVRVTDSGGLTYDETFTINLTNVNETPTDLALSSNTVAENAANGTVVGTVSGTDPDAGDTKTYSFTDSAGGRFAINSSTGQITVANGSLLDYETAASHSVTVRVTDSGGLTYDETFTINLTDVNETPTDLALSSNTVAENAVNGTVVGTVSGTDPDAGDTKTYSFTDSAGGRFAINSSTGEITVANSSLLDYEAATSHTVTVRVMDGGGLTYDEMFTINLINVNETPTDLALSSNTVAEMAANGTVVGTASTTDPDAGDTQTYQLTDDAGGRFAIDSATGEITVMDGSLLCYEDAPSHTVTVRVTDAGGLTYDETFTINLTDVNEAPTGSDATITINEDTSHALTVADFGFSDMDAGDSLSAVRIDTLPTAGTLALSGVAVTAGQVITVADITAGNLVFTPAAEASGIGYATFTFSVRDSGNLYDSGPNTLTSDVTAVNDAPVNTVPGAQTVAEDTPITITGLSVNDVDGNLSTVQLDVSNGTLWVSLAGGATISAGANDSGTLTLSGTQAQINVALATVTYQGALNFNGSDTLTVTSTDSNSSTDVDTVAITVTVANDAPTDLSLSANTVVENAANGTIIGTVSGTDPDSGDTKSYSFTDDAGGRFAINSATGVITVADGSLLDYEAATNHSVTVRVTDSGGLTYDETFTITMTNLNETPTTISLSGNTVVENAVNGTVVGTASTTDPDAGDTHTYQLTDDAGGRFAIDVNTGQITVADGTLLDYESATSHAITVRTTDAGGLTHDQIFTIMLTDVNEAPTGADATVTITEDTPHTLTAANFGFSDVDAGDSLSAVRIDTLPGAGSLTLSGVPVTVGQVISVANITAGNLVFTAAADANGTGYASFTFSVRDSNNAYDTAPNTLTFDVTPVNDAPANTVPGPQTVAEDSLLSLSGISVTDVDGNLSTVQLGVLNGTVSVTLSGTASISAGANGTNTLTLSGTEADINAALATLTYQGGTNFNGSDLLTITSTDSNSGTDVDTVAITVNAVNDPTVITGGTSGTGNEDTTLTGTLTATDVEGLADGTVFTVSTNATNGTASIDPATGLWSYSPNADWNGTDSFTVTITDDVGNATTQVISVTVTPVVDLTNDSLTTNEDTAISANVLTGTNGATADSFEGTPVLTSVTQGANGSVSFLADGTVTYTPNANFSGTDSFTYTITSGGVSETATVTVTVNAVNDPTVVTGGTSGTGTEDTTITGTLTATDADGLSDGSMFTVSTTATNGTASIDPATGLWSYTPNADYNGSDSFTVTITDDAGNSSTQVISVTVSPVVDITNDSLTTTEDSAISANVLTGTNGATTDSFEGTPVLTSVTQGANGTVTYTPNANFNGTDSFTYTITSGGVTETATVNVTVTAVNDAPVNTLPGAQTVAEDQPLTISGLSVTDVDGNLSTVQLAVGNGTLNVTLSGTASISAGANGTNTLTLSGTQADINAALATLAYQGNVNFNGSDLLTITSTDTNSVTDVDTVALTVTAVNDAPFLVSNTGSTVAEGGADTINVSELAVTDVDNTAAQLTYTIGTGPASGRLELTTAPGVSATSFTQADIAANRLIYIHNGSETTSDSFTFTVNDGAGGTLGPTTVTLTIMPINDAPTITSNGGASTAAINVAENVSAVTIVTGADVDLPTQALTYSISGGADQALFTINTVTGALNFVAPPDFEVATDANGDNVYVVQVQVLDSQGASTTQTIQVTVMNVAEGVSITPTSPTVPPILLSPVPPPSSGGSMPESETLPAVGSPTPVDSEAVPTPVLPGPTIHPVDVLPIAQGLVTPVQFPDRPLERVLEESRKLMDETKDRALFLVNDDQGRPLFSVLPVEPTPTLEPEPPEPKPSVSDLLMAKLDEMTVSLERAVNVSQERHELIARITAVTGTTLSAGFIVWALRSGTIMASLLATMPAWRHFDPLPVVKLSRHERKHRRDDATRAQEQEAAEFKGLNRVLGDKPPLKRTA